MNRRIGIGVVGVGGVASYAHLPSYAAHGLDVRGLCDVDGAVLAAVAQRFGIAFTTADVASLAARDDIDVIDVATPPSTHVAIVDVCAAARKPVLLQKPACTTASDLERLRDLRARGARVRLNMTGRQVGAWHHVKQILGGGTLGAPYLATIVNRDWWDREPGRWDHDVADYIVHEMVIHHLDLCRYWFGPFERVAARSGWHPRQQLRQVNWATVMLEYPDGLVVQILDDWTMSAYPFSSGHPLEEVVINLDGGVVAATSERVSVAPRTSSQIDVRSLPRPGQRLPSPSLDGAWFPDSFGRAMATYVEELGSPDAVAHEAADWDHLEALTEDVLLVAEACSAGGWMSAAR